LTFLLFTIAFAAFALSLQSSLSKEPAFVAAGTYQSDLAINDSLLKELRDLTLSKVFQDSVGGTVSLVRGEAPNTLRITTAVSQENELPDRHRVAVNLLSKNLKRFAVREKNLSLQFLDDLDDGQILSDEARSALLKERISQLESYLDGGPLPQVVPIELNKNALESAERRFQESGTQNADTSSVRKDMEHLERELAQVYLKAFRLDLAAIKANPQTITSSPVDPELAQRAEELTGEILALEKSSDLALQGELIYSQARSSQGTLVVCWSAALLSLLLALFNGPGKKPEPPRVASPPPEPRPENLNPVLRMEWNDMIPGLPPRQNGTDSFFQEIYSEMEHYLGRPPRRFLVLGDNPVESRLSCSLRLANSLTESKARVRLIDFDLAAKRLSKRLGRQSLPGVGDLLVEGGPVDEFFSSIAGTHIQFAPAGCTRVIADAVEPGRFERLLGQGTDDLVVIDASSASPLHLVVRMIDVVLCTTRSSPGLARSQRETQVLVAFRDAGLPVWGVSAERNQFFPLL